MSTSTATSAARQPRRLLRSVAVLSVAAAAGALSLSSAFFADTDSTATNAITSGSVDIAQDDVTIDFAYTNTAPGTTSGIKSVAVDNDGSLDITYDLATGTVGGAELTGYLELRIWDEADETDLVPDTTCDDDGQTDLYDGALASAVLTDETISSSSTQTLCMLMSFPETNLDQSDAMGQTVTATFTFSAQDDVDGEL